MRLVIANYRFNEREFFYQQIENHSKNLSENQIEEILNNMDCYWNDFTLRIYNDGSSMIIDNRTEKELFLNDLEGASKKFYVRKKLEHVKKRELQTA